mgnify:FL=1
MSETGHSQGQVECRWPRPRCRPNLRLTLQAADFLNLEPQKTGLARLGIPRPDIRPRWINGNTALQRREGRSQIGRPLNRINPSGPALSSELNCPIADWHGRFWEKEYFDILIRDSGHLGRAIRYTEYNPVKAGLVLDPKTWPWSSARWRDEYGRLPWQREAGSERQSERGL